MVERCEQQGAAVGGDEHERLHDRRPVRREAEAAAVGVAEQRQARTRSTDGHSLPSPPGRRPLARASGAKCGHATAGVANVPLPASESPSGAAELKHEQRALDVGARDGAQRETAAPSSPARRRGSLRARRGRRIRCCRGAASAVAFAGVCACAPLKLRSAVDDGEPSRAEPIRLAPGDAAGAARIDAQLQTVGRSQHGRPAHLGAFTPPARSAQSAVGVRKLASALGEGGIG